MDEKARLLLPNPQTVKVWLRKKHAEAIDGIDLSTYCVGEVIDLPPDEAYLLLAEEWAEVDRRGSDASVPFSRRATDRQRTVAEPEEQAADSSCTSTSSDGSKTRSPRHVPTKRPKEPGLGEGNG